MSKSHNSLTSIVMVLTLLGLTVVATLLYGGNTQQQAKVNNNLFLKKTRAVFDTVLGLTLDSSKKGVDKNNNLPLLDSGKLVNHNVVTPISPGFVSDIITRVKKAWEASSQSNPADANLGAILEWRPLTNGAEILFRPKSGEEYKLLLPFKWLSRSTGN